MADAPEFSECRRGNADGHGLTSRSRTVFPVYTKLSYPSCDATVVRRLVYGADYEEKCAQDGGAFLLADHQRAMAHSFTRTSTVHNTRIKTLGLLKPMHAEMPKNSTNHASNRPFPLRHVDFHLTHECLGPPHSPRQTTARSLYALPHNDATKSPLVTMGRRKFTPQSAPSPSTITTKI